MYTRVFDIELYAAELALGRQTALDVSSIGRLGVILSELLENTSIFTYLRSFRHSYSCCLPTEASKKRNPNAIVCVSCL